MTPPVRSRIRGCLLGGAIGDALGAGIEFMSLAQIRREHGPEGVTGYVPAFGRPGRWTDDTQMTLFTAEGLIRADNAGGPDPVAFVYRAYLRWLHTQGMGGSAEGVSIDGWLVGNDVLLHQRAPGNTCLSALQSGEMGTVHNRLNDSKGCGGVMRVAPVGFVGGDVFALGANLAAITHSHPTGYVASGALSRIVEEIAAGRCLHDAVDVAIEQARDWDRSDETVTALIAAVELADSAPPSPEAVERLGAGWIAEEALAISVYCALTATDFRTGVLAAVNHSGDSDSTGAITGNILGALWGEEALHGDLVDGLEAVDLMSTVADDFADHFTGDASPHDADRYPRS